MPIIVAKTLPARVFTGLTLLFGCAALVLVLLQASQVRAEEQHRQVFSQRLPNVPSKTLTAVVVSYAPGERSVRHRHSGSVLAYVLSGDIRSENSATGPARIYHAGEAFFEPEGSVHLVSENASSVAPASLLAIFVADDGATLTRPAP